MTVSRMTKNHCFLLSAGLCMGAMMVGCGSDPKPPPETPMNSDKVTVTGEDGKKGDKVAKSETASPVSIDDRIKKLCNLPEAHFDFDSAAIGGTARTVLDALAKCFVDGAGKGKSMNLVGHTDLRGPDDYNMGLGQKRAAAVAGYLQGKGLESGRLATSSRGEIEASGSDPSGMAKDRRVEILLAE